MDHQVGNLSDMHGANVTRGSRYAMITVYLSPAPTRDRSAQDIIAALREHHPNIPGIETLEYDMVKPGPPTGRAIDLKVAGKDYVVLDQIADDLLGFHLGGPFERHYQGGIADLTIEDAYSVQNRLIARRGRLGERPVGYKIGCTPKRTVIQPWSYIIPAMAGVMPQSNSLTII